MARIRSWSGALLVATSIATSAGAQLEPVAVRGAEEPRTSALERTAGFSVANLPLERALTSLYETSGVPVSFSPSRIPDDLRVSCDCEAASVGEALDRMLSRTRFRYREIEGHIFIYDSLGDREITRREPPLRLAALGGALPVSPRPAARPNLAGSVAGRVVDEGTSQGLEGVQVSLRGTRFGTLTGADGRFTIAGVPAGGYRVTATRIGYGSAERAITVADGQTATVDFALSPQALALEGVVAVGYGTQRRRDVTGAVASVRAEELEQVQVPSVAQALQGRVAGVQVTQNSNAPGGGVSIRIRGSGSLGTTNEPLYVVDGVPISGSDINEPTGGFNRQNSANPLAFLNPEDIESIEVLKDASSTAIYGARGTNGVVLITTKKGTAGGSRIEFESSLGVQRHAGVLPTLTGPEWAEFVNEWARLDGANFVPYPDPQSVEWVDYPSLVSRQNAPIMEHSVSMTGGSDETRFAVSGSYMDQQGIVRSSEFQRYSLRGNVQHQAKSWLSLGSNFNFSRIMPTAGMTDRDGVRQQGSVLLIARNFIPVIPIYEEGGRYTDMRDIPSQVRRLGERGRGSENPVAMIREYDDEAEYDRFIGSVSADAKLLEGLSLRLSGATNVVNNSRNEYMTSLSARGGSRTQPGRALLGVVEQTHYLGEALLNYDRTLGGAHDLDLMVGTTIETSDRFSRDIQSRNFPNDITRYFDIGAGTPAGGPRVSSDFSDWTLLSYLGRANYGFAGKYLFTLTGRMDGSSKFGADNKWGFFPSAAFAWRLSEERFLAGADWLSELKLRLSYGQTGNQEIGSYRSLARLGMSKINFGTTIKPGYVPVSIANPDLRWERSEQFDAGFDAGLLGNRVTLTVDVYNRVTDDLLLGVPLPYFTGFSSALQNLGSVRNRGAELALGVQVLDGFDGPGWHSTLNLARNRNTVLDIGERDEIRGGRIMDGLEMDGWLVREGEPMGVFYGYAVDGLFRSQAEADAYVGPDGSPILPGAVAGQWKLVDTDNDGRISPDDRTILGNPEPDFTFGWTNDMTWRGFSLYSFFQGTYGNEVYNGSLFDITRGEIRLNVYRPAWEDRWTPENPDAEWPRIETTNGPGYELPVAQDDFYEYLIEDGSYLRLRNLTLSYDLPASLVQRAVGMRSARLSLGAENLFTLTNYRGLNPDVNTEGQDNINRGVDVGSYPLARTFRLGIRFGL